KCPEVVSQFRPISVTNFRAKIISKILATRLKPFLPSMISELQAAFTGNRSIQDNVVVAHEVVHKLKLRKKVEEGRIKGVKLNQRCPILHHILFADDTVLFGKASVEEANKIKRVLELYCLLSGQAVNESKSAIIFSCNTPELRKREVSEVFGVNEERGMGKYLGLPMEW
ncbi:hypothetical protein LINPERPRIM_LOCUS38890, partial [Linum perenne]